MHPLPLGCGAYGVARMDIGTALWSARLTGGTVSPDHPEVPTTMEAAYAIQARIVALAGSPVAGFKIGSTSAEAQRKLGTGEPGAGPLLAQFVLPSPAVVPIWPAHAPAVEGEFAFRLGRSLPARPAVYERVEVVAAIEAVAGGIEVVGTRFAGGLDGKGRLRVTADCGVNIAFVPGPWQPYDPAMDLRMYAVEMRINGERRGCGTGARALGDPVDVLVWLANHLSRSGRALKAGKIVTTGTCTGLDPVAPGDIAVADFGELGNVEISFA